MCPETGGASPDYIFVNGDIYDRSLIDQLLAEYTLSSRLSNVRRGRGGCSMSCTRRVERLGARHNGW
jgi:hypothetical protein